MKQGMDLTSKNKKKMLKGRRPKVQLRLKTLTKNEGETLFSRKQ